MLGLHMLLAVGMAAFANAFDPLGIVAAFVLVYLVLKLVARLVQVGDYVTQLELGTRFIAWFALEVFKASVDVARRVLAGRVHIAPAVVAVTLEEPRDAIATLVGLLLTLTPGTMALEYDRESGVLYIHALDTDAPDKVERGVREIERRLLDWIDPARVRQRERAT